MTVQTDITLFTKSYRADGRDYNWTARYFPAASWQEDLKVSIAGGGLKSTSIIKIRIPTGEDIPVSAGDRLVRGSAAAIPDDAYTVVGYADNRKASQDTQHWRLVCA